MRFSAIIKRRRIYSPVSNANKLRARATLMRSILLRKEKKGGGMMMSCLKRAAEFLRIFWWRHRWKWNDHSQVLDHFRSERKSRSIVAHNNHLKRLCLRISIPFIYIHMKNRIIKLFSRDFADTTHTVSTSMGKTFDMMVSRWSTYDIIIKESFFSIARGSYVFLISLLIISSSLNLYRSNCRPHCRRRRDFTPTESISSASV